jgi:methionine-rich copper-binding protein CopC
MKGFNMTKTIALLAGIVGLTIGLMSPVLAHTDLVKSSPAADSTVAAPKAITLTFSEKVAPTFSGFDLAMDDGMKVAVKSATSADGKIVILTPQGSLMSGSYKLNWHAAAAEDGHRTDGIVSFKVK